MEVNSGKKCFAECILTGKYTKYVQIILNYGRKCKGAAEMLLFLNLSIVLTLPLELLQQTILI
jgi:hypothetical protein